MRVLMTTDTVGGVWTFTQELATGLLDLGCAVALVSLGREPSAEQAAWARGMVKQSKNFQFSSSPAALEWMQGNEAAYSQAAPLLLSFAETFSADVLHSNQFCFGALPLALPKIVTAHSDVLTWSDSCRTAPLEETPWLQRYRTLVSKGLDSADAVVAPTRWMLDALGQHFALPRERHAIPNGRTLQVPAGKPRKLQAITAGRLWDEAKGIATLRDVRSPMPLLVAGELESESSHAPNLVGEAKLVGALPQAELLQLFTESPIYICTSRYEPFGLAPLEAALCGCAVVANDLPSLREVWESSALYFTDSASLSKILHKLHGDPDLLRQAQGRSQSRAKSFTREAMAQAYFNLYQSLKQSTAELADVA